MRHRDIEVSDLRPSGIASSASGRLARAGCQRCTRTDRPLNANGKCSECKGKARNGMGFCDKCDEWAALDGGKCPKCQTGGCVVA